MYSFLVLLKKDFLEEKLGCNISNVFSKLFLNLLYAVLRIYSVDALPSDKFSYSIPRSGDDIFDMYDLSC